mmetsp:Transcript_27286/g.55920  ORF Transcript_27286/g.55920 Transcript_27286/m.55920 type:complete len:356 (+) Transcript_27286:65-1132(+)
MASSAATALYKYTYTLGRSLYVPLTSRCNSVPLPQTRGPGFLLPREVVEALVRVRQAEQNLPLDFDLTPYRSGLDDDRFSLPPYDMPVVNGLYPPASLASFTEYNQKKRGEREQDANALYEDDSLQPPISTLLDEITSRIQPDTGNFTNEFDHVVIAGEGEPTLRMEALLAVARKVKSLTGKVEKNPHNKTSHSISVRVITNGLCYGINNFGYQTKGALFPRSRHVVLRDMIEAGINRVSVALNTANRHEYDVLMSPCCYSSRNDSVMDQIKPSNGGSAENNFGSLTEHGLMPGTAHDLVVEFILEAAKVGIEVEVTGIDRPDVDTIEMDRFVRMLMSVSKAKKTPKTRWRKYFN